MDAIWNLKERVLSSNIGPEIKRPDLNFPLATPSSATNFRQILEQFGMTQYASVPMHKEGGWLDVVITRDDCTPTVDVWPPVILSDHGLVVACNLPFVHETPVYALRQIRGWRHLDRQAFSTSLSSVPAFSDQRRPQKCFAGGDKNFTKTFIGLGLHSV